MRDLAVLFFYLLTTIARLTGPRECRAGGALAGLEPGDAVRGHVSLRIGGGRTVGAVSHAEDRLTHSMAARSLQRSMNSPLTPPACVSARAAAGRSIAPGVNGDACPQNGRKERRRRGPGSRNFFRRREHDVDRRKAVRRQLTRSAHVPRAIAFETCNDQQIDVAADSHRALGLGAEEQDALGREGADQALHRTVDERWKGPHVSSRRVVDEQ
jgi:hypothetical protein